MHRSSNVFTNETQKNVIKSRTGQSSLLADVYLSMQRQAIQLELDISVLTVERETNDVYSQTIS